MNKDLIFKIILLEPTAGVLGLSTYAAHNILEPLGLEYLASYLSSLGHEVEVVQQRCELASDILKYILDKQPKVVGIGTQAYNIDIARWFARELKKSVPEIITVFGGYHASGAPEIVESEEIDYVIIGEGETSFAALLDALRGKISIDHVPNLAYWNGALRVNKRGDRIHNLDNLPFPKRSNGILSNCKMHGLMYPSPSMQNNVAMVTATRGCPYNCAFCCSQLIWNHKIYRRSPQNVIAELQQLAGQYDVNAVFFCDLTFNADKKYVIDLCQKIAKQDIPIHWYAMCNLRGMDSEIAEAMAAAKCSKIGFGIESFTDSVRTKMKDHGGMAFEEARSVLNLVNKTGILTKSYFIVGFPWETLDSLAKLEEYITNLQTDEIKVTFYVPFPGTNGYKMHSHLLTATKWEDFTTLSRPIVKNDAVSGEQFIQVRKDIFKKFYNSQHWWKRIQIKKAAYPKLGSSFEEFINFLKKQGIILQTSN